MSAPMDAVAFSLADARKSLARLRHTLPLSKGDRSGRYDSLHVLEEAEHVLAAQTEQYVRSLSQLPATQLGDIREISLAENGPGVGGWTLVPDGVSSSSPRRRAFRGSTNQKSTRVRDRMRAERRKRMEIAPEMYATQERHRLNKELGLPDARVKQVPRQTGRTHTGSVHHERLSKPGMILPLENRIDPFAPLPPITDEELGKGLLHMINRGIIPQYVDLTSALVSSSSALRNERVRFHDLEELKMRREIAETHGDAPLNVQLDGDVLARKVDIDADSIDSDFVFSESLRRSPDRALDGNVYRSFEVSLPVSAASQKSSHQLDFSSGKPIGAATASLLASTYSVPVDLSKRTESSTSFSGRQKTYEDILDEYSLHHIVIRKGRILRSSPEFISFERTFQANWNQILSILGELERLFTKLEVGVAFIDGKRVAMLAEILFDLPTVHELLECVVDRSQIDTLIRGWKSNRGFLIGKSRRDMAAARIQSVWKGFKQRKSFRELLVRHRAARVIQLAWTLFQNARMTTARVQDIRIQELSEWEKIQQLFLHQWASNRPFRRCEVHIPSLSITLEQRQSMESHLANFQNYHLSRVLFADDQTDILYISPYRLEEDCIQFYKKLLMVKSFMCKSQQELDRKVFFLYPDTHKEFPVHTSLCSQLMLSNHTIQRIHNLTVGRNAYIVPQELGEDTIRLAAKLRLPVLGCNPSVASIYGSKSGAKRIFASADVLIPVGAYDIYSIEDVEEKLASLLVEYPRVRTWIMKLDHEFSGRGLACFELSRFEELLEILESGAEKTLVLAEVLDMLRGRLEQFFDIVDRRAYPVWSEFEISIGQYGCVIEACPAQVIGSPTVGLLIEPDGEISLTSVCDQLVDPACEFRVLGCVFGGSIHREQQHHGAGSWCVPFLALREASLAIARKCFEKGIIGHISVDYVAFIDRGTEKMWAVDLNISISDATLCMNAVRSLTCATMDADRGILRTSDGNSLYFLHSGLLYNPHLSSIPHGYFFQQCRELQFLFDTQSFRGPLFHLVDTLLRGHLAVTILGPSLQWCVGTYQRVFRFLHAEVKKCAERSLGIDPLESNLRIAHRILERLVEVFVTSPQSELLTMDAIESFLHQTDESQNVDPDCSLSLPPSSESPPSEFLDSN